LLLDSDFTFGGFAVARQKYGKSKRSKLSEHKIKHLKQFQIIVIL
jgi:hypothetical protein